VPLETTMTRKADFINFNAVECAVPVIRSYLISISNNGVNHSRPLLFIPFDSACSTCNIFNISCTKIVRFIVFIFYFSLQAQNLPFSQILRTHWLPAPSDCFHVLQTVRFIIHQSSLSNNASNSNLCGRSVTVTKKSFRLDVGKFSFSNRMVNEWNAFQNPLFP